MRHRNYYGNAGSAPPKQVQRQEPGPRRPVTSRGRMVLESSRRRVRPR